MPLATQADAIRQNATHGVAIAEAGVAGDHTAILHDPLGGNILSTRGKAPKHVTWVICLILFLLAVLNHFGVINLPNGLGDWSWIVGYALLLVAVQVRNL